MVVKINIPDIGTDEFEVTEILVKVGDMVKTEQPILTIEGDKTSIDVPSSFSGIIESINVNIGDKVKTGSFIMTGKILEKDSILPNNKNTTKHTTEKNKNSKKEDKNNISLENEHINATPIIRRIASIFSIDLKKVHGSGRKNRILKDDLYNYIKKAVNYIQLTQYTKKLNNENQQNIRKFDNDKNTNNIIKLTNIQITSGKKLSRNWKNIPHVTLFDTVNITKLEQFRIQQNTESTSIKITLLSFIVKAVSHAIEKMPRFSASIINDNEILIKKRINIGIAVDTKFGLLVPVLKDIKSKGILQISKELEKKVKITRSGKLMYDDMKDGCFTISSLGGIGSTHFTPIINSPEVAILGVSNCYTHAAWNGKCFVPALMLPLSLSFDHRVIDGADGARFLTNIKIILQDIRKLIM